MKGPILLARCILVGGLLIATWPVQAGPYRLPARRDSLSRTAERLIDQAVARVTAEAGQSLADLKMAAGIAGSAGNKELQMRALRAQRDLEMANGACDAAVTTGARVLQLSTSAGDRSAMANDLWALARGYERIGALDEAMASTKRALFLSRTMNDTAAVGQGMLALADLLLITRRTDEAKQATEDALDLFTERRDTLGMARARARQGALFIQQDRCSEALSVLHHAYRVLGASSVPEDRVSVLLHLAEANIGCSRWSDARADLLAAERELRTNGRLLATPALFALRARVEEGVGDAKAALAAQKRYNALRDSLFNDRFADRVAGLRTLYQLAEQENELSTLHEADKARSQEWPQGRTLWLLALLAVTIAALIALAGMYRRMHRAIVRTRRKGQLVGKQAEEIRAKNLELERQNMRLMETLLHEEEKDVILKEIHHRVKNNLQIAGMLLRMQATFIKDQRLEELLHDCQARILSMALVHEHIYKCGDLSRVNVKAHLMALATSVLRNHGLDGRVALDLNVTYDRATLDDLIPLSLLLNELLTNAAKHAFTGERPGRINIALRRLSEDRCELTFSDNGVGLDQDLFFSTASFGLELVRTLAAQLNGTIRLLKGDGTTFQLTFAVKPERLLRKAS
ncbi:MAG: sensor histidine kinase [Flavobacteriales bacterium]